MINDDDGLDLTLAEIDVFWTLSYLCKVQNLMPNLKSNNPDRESIVGIFLFQFSTQL